MSWTFPDPVGPMSKLPRLEDSAYDYIVDTYTHQHKEFIWNIQLTDNMLKGNRKK